MNSSGGWHDVTRHVRKSSRHRLPRVVRKDGLSTRHPESSRKHPRVVRSIRQRLDVDSRRRSRRLNGPRGALMLRTIVAGSGRCPSTTRRGAGTSQVAPSR